MAQNKAGNMRQNQIFQNIWNGNLTGRMQKGTSDIAVQIRTVSLSVKHSPFWHSFQPHSGMLVKGRSNAREVLDMDC